MQLFSFPLSNVSEKRSTFPVLGTHFLKTALRNLLATIILGAVFFVPSLVQAQTPDFGLGYGSAIGLGTQDIRETVARIIKIVLGVLGIIVTLIIIYAGYVWMTAAGNEQRVSMAKKILINGVIGLLIIILAYALTVWIFRVIIGGTTGGGGGSCIDGQTSGCTRCVGGAWIYDGTLPGCTLPGADFRVKDITTTREGVSPAQNVYLCSRVQSTFSNRLQAESVAAALTANQLRIDTFAGDWQTTSNVLTFKHDDNIFTANTAYRLLLPRQGNTTPLQDQSGLTLTQCDPIVGCASTLEHFTWDFTTGEENDIVAPTITTTYPISDVTSPTYPDRNVTRSPILEAYFSESIDATSVADANGHPLAGVITLERLSTQGGSVDLTIPNDQLEVYFVDNGFRFNLIDPNLLDSFRWYRITIQGVEDLCGNQMEAPKVWEFQTNDSAPGVRSWYPTGTNQCTDVDVIVGFNSSMFDQQVTLVITGSDGSVYSATIRPSLLEPGPYQVAGSGGTLSVADPGLPYSNNFKSFVFRSTNGWRTNTTYSIAITTDLVINTNGDTLSHNWTFSTSDPASCACAPYIMSVNPNQGMAGQCVTVQGRCFTGTTANPADLTAVTINGQTVTVGGSDSNYFTTTIPDNLPVGTQAPIVATITYQNPTFGSITSNNNVNYYVNQPGVYNGPCLWSVVPSLGCVDTTVTLAGVRFGADPGSYETDQNNVTFNLNRRARQADFSLWSDSSIRTRVPQAAVDGNVYVTANGLATNGIPFDISCGSGGACSSDPNSCIPNSASCAIGYECNTSCICQAVGGGLGDPCSSDPNSCVPSDSCIPSLVCDPTDCICVDDGTGSGSSFRVSTAWPTCDGACINSEVGLRFSTSVNPTTVTNSNIAVFDYRDSGFTQLVGEEQITVFLNTITNEIYIYPDGNLTGGHYIRVVVRDELLGSLGQTIENLNFDEDGNGTNDSYAWTFSTNNTTCSLTGVETSPAQMSFLNINQSQTIYGRAISAQQCGTNQYVNPWVYDWKWEDTDRETIARVSNNDTNDDRRFDPNQTVTSVATGETQIIGAVDALSDLTDVTVGNSGIGVSCDNDPNTPQCELNNDVCRNFGLVCDPNANCTCQDAGNTQLTPGIVSVIPFNNQTNVCRNSIVQVTFNQRMDTGSIVWQSTFNLNDDDRDDVRGGLSFLTVNNGVYGCNNSQGCTVARFYPSRPYFANTLHTITLTTGIKNLAGVSLPANFVSRFTSGSQICRVETVDLQPNYYLFTTLNESVVYLATPRDIRGGLIAPIPGFYDWSWQWQKVDDDNVVTMEDIGSPDRRNLVAQPRNGVARITATAQITTADSSIGDTVGRQISDSSEAEVFICMYPWPETPPMQDSQYGFQMKYCRGNDSANLLGMLSDPGSSIISLTTSDPDLEREYLFNYLGSSLPPGYEGTDPFIISKIKQSKIGRWLIDTWQNLLTLFNRPSALAQVSQDVIGLRIYDNPNRLGPRAWYEQKSFPKGNPQDITVDGFPAIKDGTSVYILGPRRAGSIETYIYVLSYNDLSSQTNIQIFNQLLSNFRFYTLSAQEKPQVARDLKRLADASFIATQVERYQDQTGSYPALTAGSYIAGMSTSKWPSWQATLANQLGVSIPNDPINKFASYCSNNPTQNCWQNSDCGSGQCLSGCAEGANPDTCWNEVTQQYSCPAGSAVYQYRRYGVNDFRIGVLLEVNDYEALPAYLDVNGAYCNGTIYTGDGFCGDGIVQAALGEQCEEGQQRLACDPTWPNYYDPVYQQCESDCQWPDAQVFACGGYCGDGLLQSAQEACDGTAGLGGVGPATCYTDCSGFYCNPGYVLVGGVCQLDWCNPATQDCSSQIPNGSGLYQSCNFVSGNWQWSDCQVTSCNPGYVISGNSCVLPQPTVTISSPANNSNGGSSVTMTFTINQGGVYNVLRDGTVVYTTGDNAGTYTYSFTGLTAGPHVLGVSITNANGTGNAQINYTVNPPPLPTVTISSPANNSNGGSSVTMTFTINQGGVYNVLRDGVIVYTTGDNAGTYTYSFTGLSSGPHVLGVSITNANGTGNAQINYTVNPPPLPIVTITNPANGSTGTSTVFLTFNISQNGVYTILRDGSIVYTSGNVTAGSHTYVLGGLLPGPHVLGVSITNANGTGNAQVVYNVNPPPPAPPTVTINSPANGTTGGASVTMNFTISQNGTYVILRNGIGIATSTVAAGTYNYTYNNLTNGNYILGVSITNANGTGQAQINYTANTPPPTVTINSPTNGGTGNTSSVTMQYTVSAAVSASFFVDGTNVGGTSHGSSGTYSFTFTGLTNGTHTLQVNVNNPYGNASAQITYNISVPPVVTILSPANNSSGGSTVVMQFNLSQGGTYNILLDGTTVFTNVSTAGTQNYTFNNLTTGGHVLGVNISNVYGSDSDQINYTKLAEIPAAPTGLTAVASGNNITLNWTDNANNETNFVIDRAIGSPTSWMIEYATVGANITTFQDTGLSDNTYYYRVRAENADGFSAYSNTASALVLTQATIFISSATRQGNIGAGYIENVDQFCQNLADASALVRAGQWRAWISGWSTIGAFLNPRDHLTSYQPTPLYGRSGTGLYFVANQISSLWLTGIQHAILNDESGVTRPDNVWTATYGDGSGSGINCNNWQINSWTYGGAVGINDYFPVVGDSRWTDDHQIGCDFNARVYCIWYRP